MRRSMWLVVLVLAVALVAGIPAAAQQGGWFSAGVSYDNEDKQIHPYVTGELYLNDISSLGIEYLNKEIAVSYWWGESRGLYGQVGFGDGAARIEAGAWGSTDLSPTVAASGWVGASKVLEGDSPIFFVARGEVYIPVTDRLFALTGVDVYFHSDETIFGGRLAIGTDF